MIDDRKGRTGVATLSRASEELDRRADGRFAERASDVRVESGLNVAAADLDFGVGPVAVGFTAATRPDADDADREALFAEGFDRLLQRLRLEVVHDGVVFTVRERRRIMNVRAKLFRFRTCSCVVNVQET